MSIVNGQERDLSLKTASITVQVIKLDNKQMTLAVFRQLPEITILNSNRELIDGINLWGIVKYEIKDKNTFRTTNEWIVVEKDGILYRSKYPDPHDYVRHPALKTEAVSAIRDLIQELDNINLSKYTKFILYDVKKYYRDSLRFLEPKEEEFYKENVSYPINSLHDVLYNEYSLLEKELKEAEKFYEHDMQTYKQLKTLPQLFIAV